MKKEQKELQIQMRKDEIQAYQDNIDNYTHMIKMIKHEWTWKLRFKYKGIKESDIGAKVPDELVELVADLVLKDSLKVTLRNERVQQRKAKLALKALEKMKCM